MKSYRYVDGEFEIKNEIKRSLFIATVKGEVDSDGAEEFVRAVRKRYPDATHNCYAYISDELGNSTRFSDDGEPGGTAGQPILDVLKKQDLRRTAVVVTRYFGGIKLGAGGLVGAYSSAAADAVRAAQISVKQECAGLSIRVDYSDSVAVDKYLRRTECVVEDTSYLDGVTVQVWVPCDSVDKVTEDMSELTAGRAKVTQTEQRQYKKLS